MKNNKNNNSVKIYLLIITLISIFLPCKAEKNIKIIFFPPYWNCAFMEMNHSNKGIDVYCVIHHGFFDATQEKYIETGDDTIRCAFNDIEMKYIKTELSQILARKKKIYKYRYRRPQIVEIDSNCEITLRIKNEKNEKIMNYRDFSLYWNSRDTDGIYYFKYTDDFIKFLQYLAYKVSITVGKEKEYDTYSNIWSEYEGYTEYDIECFIRTGKWILKKRKVSENTNQTTLTK